MTKSLKKSRIFFPDTMSRSTLIVFLLISFLNGYSQVDTGAVNPPTGDTIAPVMTKTTYAHSPTRAGIYSAIIPGWGQAYNRKWWKIPIVYACIGTSTGFVVYNQRKYRMFKDAYINHSNDPFLEDEFSQYSTGQLFEIQDTYHEWRDISIMFLAASYTLNIIDAIVDAHFYRFDISNDLSFHFTPGIGRNISTFGFSLRF
jgi:hypothetical protein